MGRMDEEQAVFEQLTLSDFKMWSSTAVNNFYNHTILMTENGDRMRILWSWCFCLCYLFLS